MASERCTLTEASLQKILIKLVEEELQILRRKQLRFIVKDRNERGIEMIIGFIIWSMASLVFLSIGIKCRRSQEPVGFFTSCEPTQIENIEKYNKAVSRLWLVAAVFLEIMGIPLLFLEQNSVYFILVVFGVVIGMIVMMVVYLKIEGKYKKRG